MGERSTTVFFCDTCPETFEDKKFLTKFSVPARIYSKDGTSFVKGFIDTDLCPKCLNKFWEISDSNFCLVEKGIRGVDYYPHYDVSSKDNENCDVPVLDNIDFPKRE